MLRIERAEISIALGLILALAVSAVTAFGMECETLRDNVLRLHILADSDEAVDQQVKLMVRDEILRCHGEQLAAVDTRAAAVENAESLLPAIEQTARRVIKESGRECEVAASIENMYFETRTYGDITMPAGEYAAVRVTLGDGAGHNWWCVLYPPMCIPSAAAEESAETLREDTVAGATVGFEPRFKIVELLEKLRAPEGNIMNFFS